ncbi:MAG TPA: hypothetical protein VIV07_03380, partial [Sphingomicrobium sp.]
MITALAGAVAALALVPSAATAQRQPPTPEQRLDRLERQVQEMQRQVFPKGRPADTAGFADDPAATQSSVMSLDQRLDALERQMTDLLRQSEENGNRLRTLEGSVGKMQTDQDQRINALEQRMNEAAAAAAAPAPTDNLAPVPTNPPAAKPKPSAPAVKPKAVPPKKTAETAVPSPAAADAGPAGAPGVDPGEDAYSEGFRLWQAGQYDEAITTLRAF